MCDHAVGEAQLGDHGQVDHVMDDLRGAEDDSGSAWKMWRSMCSG